MAGDGEGFGVEEEPVAGLAVEGVAKNGVTQMGAVDAELVGAAGKRLEQDAGVIGCAVEDSEAGAGGLAAFANAPGGRGQGVAADGSVNVELVVGKLAFEQGDVALDGVGPGAAEGAEGGGSFGDQEDAGGELVEAVGEPESLALEVMRQGVGKGAGFDLERGVDQLAGGLVEGQKVRVFVKDLQGQSLRAAGVGGGGVDVQDELLTGLEAEAPVEEGLAIEGAVAVADGAAEVDEAEAGQVEEEEILDAQASVGRGDEEVHPPCSISGPGGQRQPFGKDRRDRWQRTSAGAVCAGGPGKQDGECCRRRGREGGGRTGRW